jgi:hypothetical protein
MTSNRGTINNKISPYQESLKLQKKILSRNSSTIKWENQEKQQLSYKNFPTYLENEINEIDV